MSKLGLDPLSASIFNKTDKSQNPETVNQNMEDGKKKPESRKGKADSVLQKEESRIQNMEKVTIRIPVEMNDWLDSIVKKVRRESGSKVRKEFLVTMALMVLQSSKINWSEIENESDLESFIQELTHKLKE